MGAQHCVSAFHCKIYVARKQLGKKGGGGGQVELIYIYALITGARVLQEDEYCHLFPGQHLQLTVHLRQPHHLLLLDENADQPLPAFP